MRLSKALMDMEMADYSAALDPAYTTLEFESMQVLAMGSGESPPALPARGASAGGCRRRGAGQKCCQGGLGDASCGVPAAQ